MEFLSDAVHFVFQLVNTEYLAQLVDQLGPWLYVVLFAIIFCETGLVVTPFLPGDSLIFAIGAVAARDIGISIAIVSPLIAIALTLVTMTVLFALLGKNPIAALSVYFLEPLTDSYSLQEIALR